ncbi:MAG TPA: hypothetical protein VIT24_12870 [Acidimicrobiales bacterium]
MIDPDILAATRRSLHAVGEHVLGAALYQGRHRIGLRQFTGGFATQNYLHIRDGAAVQRRAMVVGTEIVVRDDDLAGGTIEDRAPMTTLAAAGVLVDVEPGMAADLYNPEPMPAVDEELVVDAAAAAFLAELTAIGYAALVILCAHYVDDAPAEIQLWPEHFDLATSFDEVNYGLSPGDAAHPWPYFYVGPWSPPPVGGFWNEPFGASLEVQEVPTVDDVLAFFGTGRGSL